MRTFLLAGSFAITAQAFAQYVPDTARCRLNDVYLLGGGQVEGGGWISLAEVRAAAPGSQLLDLDLSGYRTNGRLPNYQGAGLFHGAISFDLKSDPAQGTSMKLRTGLTFAQFLTGSFELSRSERTPYDTLVSSGTGEMIILDSVHTSTYSVDHRHQRIGLDASFLFVKDFPGHWSLYGGGQLMLGATFNGITRVRHISERYVETSEWTRDASGGSVEEEENFRASGTFFASAALPFGVAYRLSKRHPFWRTLLFGMELRPGMTFGGEPSGTQDARPFFAILYGLRVDLGAMTLSPAGSP